MSDRIPSQKPQQDNLLPWLLFSLVFVLLVVPIAESVPFAAVLLRIGITAVLISAAIATQRRRSLSAIGLLVAAVAAPLTWATMFLDQPYLFMVSCVFSSLFFVAMAIVILTAVIRRHLATMHSIFGAISGYLLLGLAWAVVYWALDHVDEQAMQVGARHARVVIQDQSGEVTAFSQFIYFSFVTMSTLGYGDIAPQKPLAQTLTWTQAVTGQFYLAVLVAWLVSEISGRPRDQGA